jgi:hypothetical protein
LAPPFFLPITPAPKGLKTEFLLNVAGEMQRVLIAFCQHPHSRRRRLPLAARSKAGKGEAKLLVVKEGWIMDGEEGQRGGCV